uniref:Thioredoxin domain-containing protein n=1 Tax=Globisporangium ultimum (strain ATCC 200006 / CBS 805.95 / DAOM BR144) TaxID=431595 RepID=K3W5J9_GLOUD
MARGASLSFLVYAVCGLLCFAATHALEILTTLAEVDAIESSPRLYTLLVVSSEESKDGIDALVEMAGKAYPSLGKLERDLDGIATFGVVDIASEKKVLVKKWSLQGLPALVIYTEEPKQNPYTGKAYRNPTLAAVDLLNQPAKLKKMMRDSVPSTFVSEIKMDQVATKDGVEKFVREQTQDGDKLVLLISKQNKPSHLYRALSTEFNGQGLNFAYVKYEESADNALLQGFNVEKAPALLVIQSSTELYRLEESKMKTYNDLKAFVEPYANKDASSTKTAQQSPIKGQKSALRFVDEAAFEQEVLGSQVVWIVAFLNFEQVAALPEQLWKKTYEELQKKAGIIGILGVKCDDERAICDKYGGPGIRVFPIKISKTGVITRAETIPDAFTEIDAAKNAALASIPDQVQVIYSAGELNAFVSRSASAKLLPVLLFTSKLDTPTVFKSLSLSFPSQNVAFGVVPDADPEVKGQFSVPASMSTALACLVTTAKDVGQPEGASPFGIIVYNKKTMGPYTYQNMMHFMMSVLSQYPHPKENAAAEETETDFAAFDTASSPSSLPYVRKDNLAELCGDNKICAIGFFDGHVDSLADGESVLSKSVGVLSRVAALSQKSKEPFQFMWTSGKCQRSFAEAFGVGEFQMPTVVVFSPSKSRYATNVGLFNEENVHGFLKSVLSGKIGTTPIDGVPELREECSFEDIQGELTQASDDNEDDDDLLSEILNDEQKQRALLEEQLKAEQKETSKSKKSKKSSKKSKKKSKKSKKNNRDEL